MKSILQNKPRVLFFDIETYGGLKAHMSEISVFGYKWMGEKDVHVICGTDFKKEFKKDFTNDKPLLIALSEIWNQADRVVAHYGERFDRRFINSRLEKHGLPPLKPVMLIDTWRISKDNFALPGNSLNTLQKFFNSPYQKIDLTYEEWRRVQVADKKAIAKLRDHCKNDVLGLEFVFDKHLKHYTSKLPNWNLYDPDKPMVCPTCGSKDLEKRGYVYGLTRITQRYKCRLGHWSSGPLNKKGVVR